PTLNQNFALSGEAFVMVPLSWTQSDDLDTVRVEVAASKDFSKKILSKQLVQQSSAQVELGSPGRYYARVVGVVPGTTEELRGPTVGFVVSKALEIRPPQLIEPLPDVSLSYADVRAPGVSFSWSDVEGAETYQLT